MPRPALTRVALAALISMLAFAAPATARTPVHPSTLNPAPPDFFNALCYEGAGGTVCTLHFSDDPITDEPSGIMCGATELIFSQDRSVVGKRYYDADGNLVQRHFREALGGTISNPDTGRSVTWSQHDTILHNLAEPGELSTGTTAFSGLLTRVWIPGGGTIVMDAGTIVRDSGTDAILREGGPHPFVDYYEGGDASALQPICDAVG